MLYVVLLAIAACAGMRAEVYTLDTVENIAAYTQEPAIIEAPEPDNNDWFNPNFYTFYQQRQPTLVEQIGGILGLWEPLWSIDELQRMLETVRKERGGIGFSTDYAGEPYQEKSVSPDARIVYIGDLYGALHSLYRDLAELKRQNLIDNQLRITDDQVYICLLGDVVDRSPYSAEVLTIVLHLMHQNPDHVWYIRGKHETDAYWTNFSLRQQLIRYASHLSNEDIPLQGMIDGFFQTLPRVIYLTVENGGDKRIHISNEGRTISGVDFTSEYVNTLTSTLVGIRGEARHESFVTSNGLQMLGYTYGATEWSVFSAPVWVYQEYFRFMYDAFAILHVGSDVSSSTITLYNQRAGQQRSFDQVQTYNVSSGNAITQRKDEAQALQPLWVGSTVALSRGLGSQGPSVEKGISAGVNAINNAGGISDYLLRPFVLDDAYMLYQAYENAKYLMTMFNARAMIAPTGTATLQTYDQLVRENDGVVICPITGAPEFRSSDMKHMIHFRPSYPQEARALTQHMLDTYHTQKMAFLYQDDAFGRSLRDAAITVLQERGIEDWLAVPHISGQVAFDEQARKMYDFNPQAVGLFSTALASEDLLTSLDASFLLGRYLFGNSDLGAYSFRSFAQERGLRVTIAQVVPDPHQSDLPIVQEFRKQMQAIGWPYDVFALEAYIATQLMAQALREQTGILSVSGMMRWFEQLKQYQFKGLELTFDPEKRDLSQNVNIVTI